MRKFKVSMLRPMWVRVTQTVEAEDEDKAIDVFYNEYDPETTVIEGRVQRCEDGPTTVSEVVP